MHEAKTLTKITNFKISPRSVAKRKYVTVSGRLWRYANGWHSMARAADLDPGPVQEQVVLLRAPSP